MAEASNLKGLFSPLVSKETPEPEPPSPDLSDIALPVKPTSMIRFCPNSQDKNPRSKSPTVLESLTTPLNPQQTTTSTTAQLEDVTAKPLDTPTQEASSPTPILVPFADMSIVSLFGMPNVTHNQTRSSEKKITLILNDEAESDSDIVPLVSLKKNPSVSSSKSNS